MEEFRDHEKRKAEDAFEKFRSDYETVVFERLEKLENESIVAQDNIQTVQKGLEN